MQTRTANTCTVYVLKKGKISRIKTIFYFSENCDALFTLQEMCCAFSRSRGRLYRKSALPSTGAG